MEYNIRDIMGKWIWMNNSLRSAVIKNDSTFELFGNIGLEEIKSMPYGSKFILENGDTLAMSYDLTNISLLQTAAGVRAQIVTQNEQGIACEIHSYYVGFKQRPGRHPCAVDVDVDSVEMKEFILAYGENEVLHSEERIINSIPSFKIMRAA